MPAHSSKPPPKVLFLCTGNYYRSRFAEIVFNHKSIAGGSPWQAWSRGLATNAGNFGPLSSFAIEGLNARGIPLPQPLPLPHQVSDADFAASDLIIALKEAEHRPLLQRRHPTWAQRVEYWHVNDLDESPAYIALGQIEENVDALLLRLGYPTRAGSRL